MNDTLDDPICWDKPPSGEKDARFTLCERIRPGVEAAPWVITECRELVEEFSRLTAELSAAKAEAGALRQFRNWMLADSICIELDNGEISHIIPAKADIRGPTLEAAIAAAIAVQQRSENREGGEG